MDREDERRRGIVDGGRRLLLARQLRLLEVKSEEVRNTRERSESASCVEAIANDLAGIRFVLTAALLAGDVGETEREDLERREREARESLREGRAFE